MKVLKRFSVLLILDDINRKHQKLLKRGEK